MSNFMQAIDVNEETLTALGTIGRALGMKDTDRVVTLLINNQMNELGLVHEGSDVLSSEFDNEEEVSLVSDKKEGEGQIVETDEDVIAPPMDEDDLFALVSREVEPVGIDKDLETIVAKEVASGTLVEISSTDPDLPIVKDGTSVEDEDFDEGKKVKKFDLRSTKVTTFEIDDMRIDCETWSEAFIETLKKVHSKGESGDTLLEILGNAYAKKGDVKKRNFKFIEDLGISVMGHTAEWYWKKICELCLKWNMTAFISFCWLNNNIAQYPGCVGLVESGVPGGVVIE